MAEAPLGVLLQPPQQVLEVVDGKRHRERSWAEYARLAAEPNTPLLRCWIGPTGPCDVEVHVRTRRGSPARELAAAAEEFNADALVIGAPKHIWHRVAGSVSGWLARHARCPVIVVP